jgi:hypothetical protein
MGKSVHQLMVAVPMEWGGITPPFVLGRTCDAWRAALAQRREPSDRGNRQAGGLYGR